MYCFLWPVFLSWPYPDFRSIEAINQARNQAAPADLSNVLYKGNNPIVDTDCFAQMYLDVWAIKQVMPKFFYAAIERPKVLLKSYAEKYGPDPL